MTRDSPGGKDNPLNTGGALDALADIGEGQRQALIGQTLGDYRIHSLLGQGGMSSVYRAERIDGSFERAVAIKVSYMGALDERAREQYLSEQQILAGLNHSHISQLFDAGLTAEGWPFIVMELVEGENIAEYCNSHQLDLRQRIQLLQHVVDAVSYAHGRLILHRDIKPSNVMVGKQGVPKLLDFGIAKAVDATQAAQTRGAMTPRYASPEQMLGEPTSIASDIYQLGLLAYEVLSGETLNDHDDPLSLKRTLTTGTSVRLPAHIRTQLPVECVAVIEQCLRLAPEERYPDAAALSRDLTAFIRGFPVSAVGQSLAYRVRKYMARNTAAVSLVATAIIALIGATSWYVYQVTAERNLAQQQQALAEQSLEFMASFFQASDPVKNAGEELTATEILQLGAERVEQELAEQPTIQQRLFEEIALSFYNNEKLTEAEIYIRKTLALDEQLGIDKNNILGDYNLHQNLLASILSDKGDYQAAWKISKRIFDMAAATLGPTHDRTMKAQNNLAITTKRLGNLEQALELQQDLYRKQIQVSGPLARSTLITALNQIGTLSGLGKLDAAHELAARSISDAETALGAEHPVTMFMLGNLSQTTLDVEGPAAAISVKRKLLDRAANVYGEDSFYYQGHLAHLGAMLGQTGALAEAESAQLEAIRNMTALRGESVPEVLIARSNLISTWIDMGKYESAQTELDELLPQFMSRAGPADSNVVYCRSMQLKIYVETLDHRAAAYAQTLYTDLVAMFGSEDARALEVKTVLDSATAATAS